MDVVLVQTESFKNRILYIFTSDVLTIKVIIYFINAIDSLGNRIYIFIDYNSLLRILGGEIYLRRGRRNRTLHLYVVTATNLVFEVQIQSQHRDVA
jgi:hypothetical protein